MDRRRFFTRLGAGIAAVAAAGLAKADLDQGSLSHHDSSSVVFSVRGFTCVTCATGLEVILMRHAGVITAAASYPDAKVIISFDGNITSPAALKDAIAACGFSASEV